MTFIIDTVESLKNELESRFAEEQEQTTFAHTQQLQAAKLELDRAMELIKQKVAFPFTVDWLVRIKWCFQHKQGNWQWQILSSGAQFSGATWRVSANNSPAYSTDYKPVSVFEPYVKT